MSKMPRKQRKQNNVVGNALWKTLKLYVDNFKTVENNEKINFAYNILNN